MPYPDGSPKPGEPGYKPPKTDPADNPGDPGNVLDPLGLGRNADGSRDGGPRQAIDNAGGKISDWYNHNNGAYQSQRPVIGGNNQAGMSGNSQTAQAMGPQGTNQDQARNGQMALVQQLQDQAAGKGPSLAQMQFQKASDQNMSQAMALGQSQRGAGQGGMLKGIQTQQANIGQGMANDAGMMRLQEQMAAQNQLGQNLGQVRSQDLGVDQMSQQNNQFNAGAMNQNNQFGQSQANTMSNSNADRNNQANIAQGNIDIELEKLRQQNAKDSSPMGMIGGMLGGMSMSDERVKEDISDGDDELYSFLDSLGAHDYKYKDEKHGKGRRISPMAQELESTPLGEEFVFETEDGKAVDYGKGLGTMLASQAALHKRLKKAGL